MGYSISVQFKTPESKERMKAFLINNKDLLEQIKDTDRKNSSHTTDPCDGEDLGYAPKKKNLLGFHGRGIPQYIWDLCAWMSVKSEIRDSHDSPFFYYDKEKMKVTFDRNNMQNTLVDVNGLPIHINYEVEPRLLQKYADILLGNEQKEKKQLKLFEQLNDKWNEFVLAHPISKTVTKKPKP